MFDYVMYATITYFGKIRLIQQSSSFFLFKNMQYHYMYDSVIVIVSYIAQVFYFQTCNATTYKQNNESLMVQFQTLPR